MKQIENSGDAQRIAEELIETLSDWLAIPTTDIPKGMCEVIQKAIAQAISAERERCARAICRDCDEGNQLINVTGDNGQTYICHKLAGGTIVDCNAAAIRATTEPAALRNSAEPPQEEK